MWIEFITKTEMGGKSYAVGRRIFVSERNGATLIKVKKAKPVEEDLSGPATVRTSGRPASKPAAKKPAAKAKKAKTEK